MKSILEINDLIPFSKRHKHKTIEQIALTDSGYLKTLFEKNENLIFSEVCFNKLCEITKGQVEKPTYFLGSKVYGGEYLFDWNTKPELKSENNRRLTTSAYCNQYDRFDNTFENDYTSPLDAFEGDEDLYNEWLVNS